MRASDRFAGSRTAIGMQFEIVRLAPNEERSESSRLESAWVLLRGAARLEYGGERASVSRTDVFRELPTALHLGPSEPVVVRAGAREVEFAVVRVKNARRFPARLFQPRELKTEFRGEGLVQGACLREVRLVFDLNERPKANLVLGEVVNYPGRWSSYPPHHHVQPELYHYRFTAESGYGHAELGEEVAKVRSNDTVCIPPGLDHAQVAAPGYGMYYLWAIRHLVRRPYKGFTFSKQHAWALERKNQGWKPRSTRRARR